MTTPNAHNFIENIGMGNGKGQLSFNKLITLLFAGACVWCMLYKIDINPALAGVIVVVIGAGFGLKGYLSGSKQITTNLQAALNTAFSTNTNVNVDGKDVVELARLALERRGTKTAKATGTEETP